MYGQAKLRLPVKRAGARDLAGFMDAPEIGPANNASRPTVAPIAMPAIMPFSFEPVETLSITYIRNHVSIISMMKDRGIEPSGNEAPRVGCPLKRSKRMPLAATAPRHWLII